MYDPSVGRFLSEDPIGFDALDPNLYRYVRNSPTNATDPSGLFIRFDTEAEARQWTQTMTTKYGAKDPIIIVGAPDENGNKPTYVAFGPGDRDAVFKYADDIFGKVFKPILDDDKAAIEQSELRNRFLAGSGIFGNFSDLQASSNVDGQSTAGVVFQRKALAELAKAEKALRDKGAFPPVVVNIGGEGQPWEPKGALNINIRGVTRMDGKEVRIPNLLPRPGFDDDFSYIPDKSVDQVHMIGVGLKGKSREVTAKEIARIIKAGGTIHLTNPDDDTSAEIHKAIIDAIGDKGTVKQAIKKDGKTNYLETIITLKK